MSLRQKERHRQNASAGYARPWARTTVSFRQQVWYWVSPRRMPLTATYLIAEVAGLVAGAMSMAAGEYVSVHSQADTEQADLALERTELKLDAPGEHRELSAIYVGRGLDPALAKKVAVNGTAHGWCQPNKSADTA